VTPASPQGIEVDRHPADEPWSIVPPSPTAHTLEEELPQTPARLRVVPLGTLDQTRVVVVFGVVLGPFESPL
jgi:hypothetical protein